MRFALVFATLAWSISAIAQITGKEVVTSQNAASLKFSFELTEVPAGARIRIFAPSTIANGFEYAYAGVWTNDYDNNLVLSFRPETLVDYPSKSKFIQFVIQPEFLSCVDVTFTYLNPERPMHSDYLMEVDLATFLDEEPPPCAFSKLTRANE